MHSKFVDVKISILRWVSSDQPGFVECSMIDSDGKEWLFTEKLPLVTFDDIDEKSSYPHEGFVRCQLISAGQNANGETIFEVDTEIPWHVGVSEDVTVFHIFEKSCTPVL